MVASKRNGSTEGWQPGQGVETPNWPSKRPRGVPLTSSSGAAGVQHAEFIAEEPAEPSTGSPSREELFEGFKRSEVVWLLRQTLSDLGFHGAKEALELESGTGHEEVVAGLRSEILAGHWDEALLTTSFLSLDDLRAPLRKMLMEQKCLELHQEGQIQAAQEVYDELAQEDLQLNGGLHGMIQALGEQDRHALLEKVERLLPELPPRRLPELLWQAVRYQHLHCLYSDLDPSLMSSVPCLVQNYSYTPPPLPTHCIRRLDHHRDEVWFASISHDGRLLATSSKDESIVIWERGEGSSFTVLEVILAYSESCSALAWSLDGQSLLSASNCTICLWTLPGLEAQLVLSKHTDAVTSVTWFPDSLHFASAGFDRCICLWKTDGNLLHKWELTCRIQDLAATKDGSKLLVVDSDKGVKVFDVASRNVLMSLPESDAVTSICVSRLRDELLVNVAQHVSALQEGPSVRLWDLTSRRVLQRYLGHFQSRFVVRSCFAGDREEMVVSGSEDAQVYIWHRHYGTLLQVLAGHSATVNTVCWVRGAEKDTAWLISASDDGTLRVWGSEDEYRETPHPEANEATALTPTDESRENRQSLLHRMRSPRSLSSRRMESPGDSPRSAVGATLTEESEAEEPRLSM